VAEFALDATVLNAGPQDAHWGVEEVQFHGYADVACALAQSVALRASPGAPFDHHDRAELQQALRQPPLELLDPLSRAPIEEIDLEVRHPLVGAETNRPKIALELPGQGGLAGARKPADDDESAGSSWLPVAHAGEDRIRARQPLGAGSATHYRLTGSENCSSPTDS